MSPDDIELWREGEMIGRLRGYKVALMTSLNILAFNTQQLRVELPAPDKAKVK